MKRFRCGDVVPGCAATFEGTREDVLAAMAHHATHDHGVAEVTPDLLLQMENSLVSVP